MSQKMGIIQSSTSGLLTGVAVPKKTESYSPVSHGKVIDLTLSAIDKAGLKLLSESYKSSRGGNQGMGFYRIGGGDKEMNIELIWHNSYDKSMPLRAALGTNVIVCTNGMVRGDMGAFKRRHTGTILTEFSESISTYIGEAGNILRGLQADRERLKEITLSKRITAELLGRMHIEEELINATQLGIIKKELIAPTFDYKAKDSAWELYNHATFALKGSHPTEHLEQHTGLHKFFTEQFQLA